MKDGIAKWNCSVYEKIAKELGLKSDGGNKSVYLAAKRLAEKENLFFPKRCDSNESLDQDQEDDLSQEKKTECEFTLFDPNFEIRSDDMKYDINIENIALFSYSEKEMKLQCEWSDTLNEIIWHFSRCPCAWRFDKHRVVANEKVVFGTCRSTDCGAKLFAYTENNKSKLKIIIKNFNDKAIHIEKRAMKYANKEKIAAMLKINAASFVQAELANEMLEPYDYCPANLPNKAALRKLKQRENEKSFRDPDPIKSLCMLKVDGMFINSITDIGIDPFYCFMSTPEQKEWLRLSTRFKKCIISIDSTGIQIHNNDF